MKISKSKQELARIISENGGWRDGYGFSAQDGDDCAVWFYDNAPVRSSGAWWVTSGSGLGHCGIEDVAKLPNWHQTILSSEEYFHLYPAPDAKPTIEQLAADYRNAKDYAERKQKEADNAKADVGAKLKALKLAGKEHGLLVSPITAKQEPELVITRFTGKFHSTKHGDQPSSLDAICDGCGKRFGTHVGFDCRP